MPDQEDWIGLAVILLVPLLYGLGALTLVVCSALVLRVPTDTAWGLGQVASGAAIFGSLWVQTRIEKREGR